MPADGLRIPTTARIRATVYDSEATLTMAPTVGTRCKRAAVPAYPVNQLDFRQRNCVEEFHKA